MRPGGGCPKGHKQSEEHKQHISEAVKGRKLTEYAKQNISEAMILAHKKNKKTEEVVFIDENGNEQTLDQHKETLGIL